MVRSRDRVPRSGMPWVALALLVSVVVSVAVLPAPVAAGQAPVGALSFGTTAKAVKTGTDVPLDGATGVPGSVWLFVDVPRAGVASVTLSAVTDGGDRLLWRQRVSPYGDTPEPLVLAEGEHTVRGEVVYADGARRPTPTATFTVGEPSGAPRIEALPGLDGATDGVARAVNDAGLVVGEAHLPSADPADPSGYDARAVAWDGRSARALPLPGGFDDAGAYDVDDLGRVVGAAFEDTEGEGLVGRPMLVDGDAVTAWPIPEPYVFDATATGIDESGRIVGSAVTMPLDEGSGFIGAVGSTAGPELLLGFEPETFLRRSAYSDATAVNGAGQVVGASITPDREALRAYRWEAGAFTDLGTLGGRDSRAFDVSDAGVVVGSADTAGDDGFSGPERAFLWRDGRMTDLGTLGGDFSRALGVSDATEGGPLRVVGVSDTADGARHAFLWQDGRMTDLGALDGDEESAAEDVNAAGVVVGWSADHDTERRRAVAWRP